MDENIFELIVVGVALLAVAVMAFVMMRLSAKRTDSIRARVKKVAEGDFSIIMGGANDEFSKIFLDLVHVLNKLITEITYVTYENRKGNTHARINIGEFGGGYRDTAIVINALLQTMTESHVREMNQHAMLLLAEENNKAKSRFLAMMSHEIRTPISAVLGIAEIQLQNTDLPLEAEEAFAKIYSSGSILLNIVNDILDLSKIEAGKMELVYENYDVANMIADIVHLNLGYMGSKQLDFIVDVAEDVPAHLIGDMLRIKQVMNNLLSNSFKYTDEGSVELRIYATDGAPGFSDIHFHISDTGRGMTELQVKALFDEYARFHEQEARFIEGTGLGMAITQSLLKVMNGTITVDSQAGHGTRIHIILPQQVAGDAVLGSETTANLRSFNIAARQSARKINTRITPMPYGRVLIVDDIETNIYVAKGLMKRYQLQVESVTSGAAAIEKIALGEVYHIIFMDQMMPEMNGTEAAAAIREMGYTHPIVALTANALVGQAEEYLKSGFDGFLSKPLQTAHLNGILNKYILDRHPEIEHTEALAPQPIGDENDYLSLLEVAEKIRSDFMEAQANTITQTLAAISDGDINTAHRLLHTLKGAAGLLREARLTELAAQAVGVLKSAIGGDYRALLGTDAEGAWLTPLAKELERVLAHIHQLQAENTDSTAQDPAEDTAPLDPAAAAKILDELQPLLENNFADALNYKAALKKIPGTDALIKQIDDFEFITALELLRELRLKSYSYTAEA